MRNGSAGPCPPTFVEFSRLATITSATTLRTASRTTSRRCWRSTNSLPAGLLILRRELPAGLDPERRIRGQDTIGIHVRVHEVVGVFGDDAAGELECRGIQREALHDVQFAAVREVARQATGQEAHRVDHERVAVPAADRVA